MKSSPKHQSIELTRSRALACIPVRNHSINFSEGQSGLTLIEYPLPLKPLLYSVFQRFNRNSEPPTKKLELDQMGSRVWEMINDSNNVETIIKRFAGDSGLSLNEAEVSVTRFLRELGRRGIIGMHEPEGKKSDRSAKPR